jgi:malonate transporter and related proteins
MAALLPVLFVLLLGFFAGRRHEFEAEQAIGFSKLALRFSLSAALFVGMYSVNRATPSEQGLLALVIILGYAGVCRCLGGMRSIDRPPADRTLLGRL